MTAWGQGQDGNTDHLRHTASIDKLAYLIIIIGPNQNNNLDFPIGQSKSLYIFKN